MDALSLPKLVNILNLLRSALCDLNFAVYNIWVCVYAIVLCVGESGGYARHEEHMSKGTDQATGGDTDMVLGHYFSLLWAYQLSCGGSLS